MWVKENIASVRKVTDDNVILKLVVADLRLKFTNLGEGAAGGCELLPKREEYSLLKIFNTNAKIFICRHALDRFRDWSTCEFHNTCSIY